MTLMRTVEKKQQLLAGFQATAARWVLIRVVYRAFALPVVPSGGSEAGYEADGFGSVTDKHRPGLTTLPNERKSDKAYN